MLCRVSCEACHISSLWTDDPNGFLESVCLRYRHCQAKLIDEGFERPLLAGRARAVPSRRVAGKTAAARSQSKQASAPN